MGRHRLRCPQAMRVNRRSRDIADGVPPWVQRRHSQPAVREPSHGQVGTPDRLTLLERV
jgi:hypothetical protein